MKNPIREKIRFALEPDNSNLINEYLECNRTLAEKSHYSYMKELEAQYALLLDTISDEYLPVHWRQLCLDQIYKPLATLWSLADNENTRTHVRQLFTELRITGNYFESGLSAPNNTIHKINEGYK